MISSGNNTRVQAQKLAEKMRDVMPTKRIMTNYGSNDFKKQFSQADKYGAKLAIVIGENEILTNKVVVKNLQSGEQIEVEQDQVADYCLNILG